MSFRPRLIISCLLFSILIFAVLYPLPARGQEELWCYLGDAFSFEFDSDNNLLITHSAAMYNCCPEPVSWDIEQTPGLIYITEFIGEDEPCDCICCFELSVQVTEIPAGMWTIRYRWFDFENLVWSYRDFMAIVPETDSEGFAELVDGEISPCIEVSSVPDPQELLWPWGAIKSRYRGSR